MAAGFPSCDRPQLPMPSKTRERTSSPSVCTHTVEPLQRAMSLTSPPPSTLPCIVSDLLGLSSSRRPAHRTLNLDPILSHLKSATSPPRPRPRDSSQRRQSTPPSPSSMLRTSSPRPSSEARMMTSLSLPRVRSTSSFDSTRLMEGMQRRQSECAFLY
jgi:hypothetical protein